ncbi:histone-lysine N-methyltransferase SETMAR [Trichonephila clavipes]|nr:histone-lysine N-methyltransferase SETMAR [Trichonephila clavipes]
MENQKGHFRHILLFYFRKGKNASQAHKQLCAVYGNEALNERQCQNWFAKFRSGDFSLKDEKRSGRPVEVDDDLINAIIDSDRHSTTREIAEKLHVSHTCIENHLKQLGYVQKLDTWVPHELKETHLTQRINSCDLLKKPEKIVEQASEPTQTSKADIHQKKVLLSVWWDYKGIVYFELLSPNRTISSDVYIEQLTKLNNAVEEKRPELTNRKGIVFHHDNAHHPHTSLVTRQKLLELGWDVLQHPPYSPDLAPSDYFLFRSLQNSLNDGDRFNSCQVIYSHFGLAIHQNDHQARRRFVEWAQNEIAVVPDFLKRILFSDEAHFWLNGYVNKQNCRIWSEANPQVYVDTPLHPEKLTVWCALWAGGILLQKR